MNSKTGNRDKHPFVYPSRDQAQRYRRELQDAVEAVRERRFPHRGALVWPAGLDRAIVVGLPLPESTHKRLRQAGLMEGNNPLTAHEVLCVPCMSSRAIGELLFAVDEFLSEYVKIFEGRPEPASVVAMRLRMEVEKLTPREVLIVEHRVLSRPRKTLKEIAARCGVSCERIRQIQTGTERRIRTACGHELRFLAGALHNELAPSAEQSALHRRIDGLLPNGVGPTEELVTTLFRQALLDEMGLTPNQSEGLRGGIAR